MAALHGKKEFSWRDVQKASTFHHHTLPEDFNICPPVLILQGCSTPTPPLPAVGRCWHGNSPGTRDRCQSALSAWPGAQQGAGEEGTGLDALCGDDLQEISESHQHSLPLHAALGEAGKVEGDSRQWSCAGSGAEGEGRELPGTKEHLELSALTPLPSAKARAFSNSIISSCLAERQGRNAATRDFLV